MRLKSSAIARRVRALRPLPSTESTLLVPVPEAEFVRERWTGDRAGLGVPGLPFHVTVLYPFLDPSRIDEDIEAALTELAEAFLPFTYELNRVERFPGVLFLSPAPRDQFIELTRTVHARWPSHPPYGGAFDAIVPHVTLALGEEPTGLATAVEPELPVNAVARELLLLERRHQTWSARSRFTLGV
jgi:2'-5' RNA ligase